MYEDRQSHTATTLNNGKVLIIGEQGPSSYPSNVELYDPVFDLWQFAGNISFQRRWHVTSILSYEKVLICGGESNVGSLNSTELYT